MRKNKPLRTSGTYPRHQVRVGEWFTHNPGSSAAYQAIAKTDPRNKGKFKYPCVAESGIGLHTPKDSDCILTSPPDTPKSGEVFTPGMVIHIIGEKPEDHYLLIDVGTLRLLKNVHKKKGTPVVRVKDGKVRFIREGTKMESDVDPIRPGDFARVNGEEVIVLNRLPPSLSYKKYAALLLSWGQVYGLDEYVSKFVKVEDQ